MAGGSVIDTARDSFLGAQSVDRGESRLRGRMDVVDDRAFYRTRTLFRDSACRVDAGVRAHIGTIGFS